MKTIILLTHNEGLSQSLCLNEVEDIKSFASIHGLDIHESEDAEFIAKILQIRTEIKSSIETCQYENAATLRDNEWQMVMKHFVCGPRLGDCLTGQVGYALVYMTYNIKKEKKLKLEYALKIKIHKRR